MPSRKKTVSHRRETRIGIEALESRQLLSASLGTAHRNLVLTPAATSSSVSGYTPAQIRHAYGFDQVSGTGAGQTIAIVDAFNDPNIAADLHTFDLKLGLADPPNFNVISQTGGSVSNVKTDGGWSSEIALDVEWAHAIAPQANILLVEAKSDNISDLMAAVDTARSAPGVSVVSMSWGGSEFGGQLRYDKSFTTPAGHIGVTFVASSGDSGSWGGPEWPSSSPNVLSVGGTSLRTSDSTGAYSSESGWSYSGGGASSYEKEPSFQTGAQSTGTRTTPDVSYDANPNTGFPVYSSVSDGGYVGWSEYGGTSAGSPQWAALIAIADQTRASAGKSSLDGATGTLPALYKLYSAPTSATYASYLADFNDIAQGSSSYFMKAHTGYDGVTGLGTPKAAAVIAALAGVGTGTVTGAKATASAPTHVVVSALTSAPQHPAAPPHLLVTPLKTVIDGAAASSARDLVESASALRFTASLLPSSANQSLGSSTVTWRIAFPAVGQGAVETLAQTVIGSIGVDGPALQAIQGAATTLLDLGRPDALAAFSDAIAGFAHESASLGTVLVSAATHTGAWAATAAVLGIDAVLIGCWRAGSQTKRRDLKKMKYSPGTFSLHPVV